MSKERKKYDPNALTFLEHLEEFRKRIISIAIVLAVLTAVGFFFSREIVDFLLRPGAALLYVVDWLMYWLGLYGIDLPTAKIDELLQPLDITFQFINPTEGFATHLQVAFITALIASSPYVFWHLWRFIAPALMAREKRMVIPFVFFTASYTDKKDREFALSLGADEFIIKPVEMSAFADIITRVLDSHRLDSASPSASLRDGDEVPYLKE